MNRWSGSSGQPISSRRSTPSSANAVRMLVSATGAYSVQVSGVITPGSASAALTVVQNVVGPPGTSIGSSTMACTLHKYREMCKLLAMTDLAERTRIFKAALGCFSRYGLRRTTMDDVAAAAGVSRKTVYNYFTNKSALIAEVIFEEALKVNARARKGSGPRAAGRPAARRGRARAAHLRAQVRLHRDPAEPGRLRDRRRGDRPLGAGREVMHEYWDPILDVLDERGELPADLDRAEVVAWLTFVHVGLCARRTTDRSDRDQVEGWLARYVAPAVLTRPRTPARDPGSA